MIRDVTDFRRTGVASRRVVELGIPVEAWRAAMCRTARRDGARVRTFLVPSPVAVDDPVGRTVFAVRVDPPPDPHSEQGRHVRWWRVDELRMPFRWWRGALHRVARRERARLHTFLVPRDGADGDPPDQLVYVVWVDAETGGATSTAPSSSVRAPRPVTDLARYAAARHRFDGGRPEVDGTEG
jgi:hypothetical protein